MSQINLGTVTTSSGSTSGLGFQSGLDSAALIEGILAARTAAITDVEDTITLNNEKAATVSELKTLLDRFQTAANLLRAEIGVDNEINDFFKYTTSSLVSSTSTEASNFLSITSLAGASLGSYSITDVVTAVAHQIRKDGFSSETASVVGNASVIDNYQASIGTVSGSVLNAATPITFSNPLEESKATIDVAFGSQNQFGSTDTFTVGATTITFGGGGGDDIDISSATTVDEKVTLIATRLNAVTTGDEANYTYTADGSTLKVTRDAAGSNSEVGTNLNISADFSVEGSDATQTVKIGSAAALNVAAGGTLNSLGTDGDQGTTATSATIDLIFGTQNKFDATDSISFSDTTITFGGTGGDDIDISSATSLDDKLDAIVTRLNSVSTPPENTYTYSRDSTGIITATQDTTGTIASTGNDITIAANFSTGTDDTTQTVAIGRNFENNGSASGSVAASNGQVSGSVSANGVDGRSAASKATLDIKLADNNIDSGDTLVIGSTTLTFGGGGGDDITLGASLADTLVNIADRLNAVTGGEEAGYTYTTNGSDSLTITRDKYGSNSIINTSLTLSADFSSGADTANTVQIGTAAAANVAAGGDLNSLGTDGVSQTEVPTAKTTHISSLSGAITVDSATFAAGTSSASSFTPNNIEFKVTVNGQTYTSKPVILDGGSVNAGGAGDNGLGNTIAAGTVITFVKDGESTDGAEGTEDVTFNLVVGDTKTIANTAEATTYASEVNTFLNTTNTITVTQNPTVPEFRAGTFSLGGVEITLDEGDNLSVIKSKINAVSATSGVAADIVKVDDDNFSLVLKSTNEGIDNKILEYGDGDAGDPLSGTIQFGLDNIAFTQVNVASDASFSLDGQTITRPTNNIDDVIDKTSFSLISDTPSGTTLSASVKADTTTIKNGITDFLTAYNDIKFFISAETDRDENGDFGEDSRLGDEAILQDILIQIEALVSSTVSGITGSNKDTLFEIGIDRVNFPGDSETPATSNIFVIDDAKFDSAISSDFDAVKKIFTFDFTSNSTELSLFEHGESFTLNNFILDIDNTRESGDQVRVLDASTNAFLFNATLNENGNTITGLTGTALEGSTFIYTGDGSDTIIVSATQGIADSLFGILDNYTKDNGIIDDLLASFTSDNETLQDKIDRETTELESERNILLAEFNELEAIIASANSTLSFLEAERDALNNS